MIIRGSRVREHAGILFSALSGKRGSPGRATAHKASDAPAAAVKGGSGRRRDSHFPKNDDTGRSACGRAGCTHGRPVGNTETAAVRVF